MKVIGKKKPELQTPEACHRKALQLNAQMEKLNPYQRPRGFVFKAKTWKEYREWRKKQENPRLW